MNVLNLFQTFLILICFLLSISQTYHHHQSNSNNEHVDNDPNCDYVVHSDNRGDPIGVCIAMGEKESYRTDYDETIGAVYLQFNSNDCTGKSEEYLDPTPNSNLIEINLGTGNLCKTYGIIMESKLTSKTDGVLREGTNFDTQLFGRCKYSPTTGLHYIVDYCKKDIMVHIRWFFDDECSDKIPQKKYVSINQDNEDIIWKTMIYWEALIEGSGAVSFFSEDRSSVWEVNDIQCVAAQNNINNKRNRKTSNGRNQNEASSESRDNVKGSSWSKY